MKKVMTLLICVVIAMSLTACNFVESFQDFLSEVFETEQSNKSDDSEDTNSSQSENSNNSIDLYKKYAGTYVFYSLEDKGEMYYVGNYYENELLTLDYFVLELYETKKGKIVIFNGVINFNWTISNSQIITNTELEDAFKITINGNMVYFNSKDGVSCIRLKKIYI